MWLTDVTERLILQGATTFYLGGYGEFDSLAASVLREHKKRYSQVELVLALAYFPSAKETSGYDATVYPPDPCHRKERRGRYYGTHRGRGVRLLPGISESSSTRSSSTDFLPPCQGTRGFFAALPPRITERTARDKRLSRAVLLQGYPTRVITSSDD